jgi:hypothetical protein
MTVLPILMASAPKIEQKKSVGSVQHNLRVKALRLLLLLQEILVGWWRK